MSRSRNLRSPDSRTTLGNLLSSESFTNDNELKKNIKPKVIVTDSMSLNSQQVISNVNLTEVQALKANVDLSPAPILNLSLSNAPY